MAYPIYKITQFSPPIRMKNYWMNTKLWGYFLFSKLHRWSTVDQLTYQTSIGNGVEIHFSKTCEIEKDHLVDKTTQQAEQIRKSIQKLDTMHSIIDYDS